MTLLRAIAVLALVLLSGTARAGDYLAPREADWIARDFKFHTGEVMPELKLHYLTIGDPAGLPVLVLNGNGGAAGSMLTPAFAGELFGPGQALDASKYYIIIPDALGHGKSAKPSDGLKTKFPRYNYADMVDAQYRLLTEGLGISHVRLIIGNSMGGMNTWLWGQKYPSYMDALVPMASQPTAMASRNWMLQRMLEIVRNDPDDNNGTPAAATATDANDFLWQWSSSADYDASGDLEKIQATVLAINSSDDEINPPETGLMTRAVKRLKNGRLFLILTSDETSGHLTTGHAKFYKQILQRLLDAVPRKVL